MWRSLVVLGGLLLPLPLVSGPADAVTNGQRDTFQDGTLHDWFLLDGADASLTNQPSGGPLGIDDAFLVWTVDGRPGVGVKPFIQNSSQWIGDYLSTGVTSIRMAVNNFGLEDQFLWLVFWDFEGAGPPVNLAYAGPVLVPAGSGWQTIDVSIEPADLFASLGTAAGALSSTDEVAIQGTPVIAGTLGFDDITAVPEPASSLGFTGVATGLIACRRLRARARTGCTPPPAPAGS